MDWTIVRLGFNGVCRRLEIATALRRASVRKLKNLLGFAIRS